MNGIFISGMSTNKFHLLSERRVYDQRVFLLYFRLSCRVSFILVNFFF